MKRYKLKQFNQPILYRTVRFLKNKLKYLNNRYVKTLSTKALVITLVIVGVLNSPLIPGGFAAVPLVTKFIR